MVKALARRQNGGRRSSETDAHIEDINESFPVHLLPALSQASTAASAAMARKGQATLVADCRSRNYQWTLDQAVYDTGVRVFMAPRARGDAHRLRERLPPDACYWSLHAPATMLKHAKKVVGLKRNYPDLVRLIGMAGDAETLLRIQQSIDIGSKRINESTSVLLAGTPSKVIELAEVVTDQCPGLRVAGVCVSSLLGDSADSSPAPATPELPDELFEALGPRPVLYVSKPSQSRINEVATQMSLRLGRSTIVQRMIIEMGA